MGPLSGITHSSAYSAGLSQRVEKIHYRIEIRVGEKLQHAYRFDNAENAQMYWGGLRLSNNASAALLRNGKVISRKGA